MKKIMTSLALALIATAALAQQKQGSFSFAPRVGVTIANLTDIGRDAMTQTDAMILNIMTRK